MSNNFNESKFTLIKFGVSEMKRKNLKQTYTIYCNWIKENNNKKLSYSEIFSSWKKIGVYQEEKKEIDINREKSFLENHNFLTITKDKNGEFKIEMKEISKNWDNEEQFYSLSGIDFSFFQFLLKERYHNIKKHSDQSKQNCRSSFYAIFSHLIKNKRISPSIILGLDYKDYIKQMVEKDEYRSILNLIKFKSGSPKKTNGQGYNKDNLRDKVIETFTKDYEKFDYNFSSTINELEIYFDYLVSINANKVADGFLELILGHEVQKKDNLKKDSDNDFFKLTEWIKNKEKTLELVKKLIPVNNKQDLIKRINNRLITSSYNSYKNLIVNHINCLSSVFDIGRDNNFTIRDPQFEKILEKILEDENKILSLDTNKFYTSKEIIEHFNLDVPNSNFSLDQLNDELINSVYTLDKMIPIFEDINNSISENQKEYKFSIQSIIDKHEHIKGQVDWPTFYEFIIGMVFLKKEYGFIANDWKGKMEKHLNLKLDGALCPIRFAGGGIADINFIYDNTIFNVEPTTQLVRQCKMEYDSCIDHLISECKEHYAKSSTKDIAAASIIVAPILETKFKYAVNGWNLGEQDDRKIILFDNEAIIDFLNNKKTLQDIKFKKGDNFLEEIKNLKKKDFLF